MFGLAISIATLPLVSRQASRGDMTSLKATYVSSLTMAFLLTIPASAAVPLSGARTAARAAARAVGAGLTFTLDGIGGAQPFGLILRADGRLTLVDPVTAQRIDLANDLALGYTTHGGVAAHLPDDPHVHGDQQYG